MAEDVIYLLSGGNTNTDPTQSLGGLPSSAVVKLGINTLFSQVSTNEATNGGKRYRCIYISNNTSNDLSNVRNSIVQPDSPLSSIEIGVFSANEIQLISILGSPTSGSFKLKYTVNVGGVTVVQTTDDIVWNLDQTITSHNIQEAINLLTYLSGVIITSVSVTGGYGYSVEFSGNDGKRSQNILEVVDFAISGATGYQITRTVGGGPINQVAADIGFENQSPFDVSFGNNTQVGLLRSGDIYGIWIKRITPAGTEGNTQTIGQATLQTLYSKQA